MGFSAFWPSGAAFAAKIAGAIKEIMHNRHAANGSETPQKMGICR
jgi:hypothetical protein